MVARGIDLARSGVASKWDNCLLCGRFGWFFWEGVFIVSLVDKHNIYSAGKQRQFGTEGYILVRTKLSQSIHM